MCFLYYIVLPALLLGDYAAKIKEDSFDIEYSDYDDIDFDINEDTIVTQDTERYKLCALNNPLLSPLYYPFIVEFLTSTNPTYS